MCAECVYRFALKIPMPIFNNELVTRHYIYIIKIWIKHKGYLVYDRFESFLSYTQFAFTAYMLLFKLVWNGKPGKIAGSEQMKTNLFSLFIHYRSQKWAVLKKISMNFFFRSHSFCVFHRFFYERNVSFF